MDALPATEAYLPVVLAAAAALALPFIAARLFSWVYLGDEAGAAGRWPFLRAFAVATAATAGLLAFLGTSRLGPALVAAKSDSSVVSPILALIAIGAAYVAARRALRHHPAPASKASEASFRVRGVALGFVFGLSVTALPVAAIHMTEVSAADIRDLSTGAAMARLRIAPWDGEAMLALGWRAREDGELEIAGARLDMAGRMDTDPRARHILAAELHAAAGDCVRAREAFDASLAAQAEAAFAEGVFTELSLGDYELPPTLIAECELNAP